MQSIPTPLRKQPVHIILIGTGCFFIGTILSYVNQDRTLLFLSLMVLAASLIKSLILLWALHHRKYITIEGICESIIPTQKFRWNKVFLITEDGTIQCIYADRKWKLTKSSRYRFYYLPHPQVSEGFYQDGFLGYEEINNI